MEQINANADAHHETVVGRYRRGMYTDVHPVVTARCAQLDGTCTSCHSIFSRVTRVPAILV